MGLGIVRGVVAKFQYITKPLLPVLWVPLIYAILGSIGLILNFWTTGDMLNDEQHNKTPEGVETFDFIVVGAGSAGALVANRLSKKYRVLLLEAGGEANPLQFIPGFGVFFVNYPETDWMHKTVPQKYASLNSVNQQSSWSAGRGLGGTGTLNLMIHLRGHKNDFDNWARITGDPSWSWEGVLPYFKSYEDYEESGDPRYHGFGGDLRVQQPDYVGMGPEFIRAGEELGYSHCDLNAPFTEGFDFLKYPIKDGIRQGSYKGFLEPIRRLRKNLVIRKFAHVNRVLFKHGNVAYGVEYDRHGATRQVFASKEVIISAGTVNTPKLLMLSGIGPRAQLQEQNIPVLSDLPVGENLQDHIAAYVGPFFIDKPRAVALERDLTPSAFVQWFLGGKGILSTTGVHATGIISSSLAKARGEGDWPDIQYFLFGFSVFKTFGATFAHGFGLSLDEQNKFYEHAIGKESFLVAVSGARPFSRGNIKLGGRSPYDKPIIDPRYFTDPGDQDLHSILEGVKILLYLTQNTTAMGHELGTRYTTQSLPGCEHLQFQSDEYWECYVRRYTVTLHHPVGTASMGTVVDTKLRVYGTQNLRVIDCSVEPVLVVTNTQASGIMIGEKGSDMVLKYWEEQEKKQSRYGPPTKYGAPLQYGAPEPSQPYGAPQPQSSQSYAAPQSQSSQSYAAPQSSQSYAAPQSSQSYAAPQSQSSQSYAAPQSQSSQSYAAPQSQSSQSYTAPAAAQTPQSYQSPAAPQSPQSYQSPEPPQSYGTPELSQSYEVPPSSQSSSANPWWKPSTVYNIASLNSTNNGYPDTGYYTYNTVK